MAPDHQAEAASTPAVGTPAASTPAASTELVVAPACTVIDTPEIRVHRVADLISLLGVALGIVVVLLLGAYARGTTEGITADVHGISGVLQRLLIAPVNLFSGIVTLILPAAVVVDLAVRREPRRILEALGAAAAGFALTLVTVLLVQRFGSADVVGSLTIGVGDQAKVTGHGRLARQEFDRILVDVQVATVDGAIGGDDATGKGGVARVHGAQGTRELLPDLVEAHQSL